MVEAHGVIAPNSHEWRSRMKAKMNAERRASVSKPVPSQDERAAADLKYAEKLRAECPNLSEMEIADRVMKRRERINERHANQEIRNETIKAAQAARSFAESVTKVAKQAIPDLVSISIVHKNLEMAIDRKKAQEREYERRLALSSSPVHFTKEEWLTLCEAQGHKCACCKQALPLTIDHIVPVSRGGRDGIQNIQGLCRGCNSAKGTKTADYRQAA